MKQELQEKLFEKHPKIFEDRNLPATQSLMCFGIECGDGWYELIDTLCEQLQTLCDDENIDAEEPFQVKAFQVKEKWGGLRFYVNNGSSMMSEVISMAERMSRRVCYNCGSMDRVTFTKGWIVPLCHSCMEKEKNKKC